MKITPFYLFLILLVILVISIFFVKNNYKISKENFITYQKNVEIGDSIFIPTYSQKNKVIKLYDNLFFDSKNGNLIEIDSPKFTNNSDDLTESSIITTTITVRGDGKNSVQYKKSDSTNVSESNISVIPQTYSSYTYCSLSTHTNKYSVTYIPWGNDTYIHILDITLNCHVATYSMVSGKFSFFKYSVDNNNNPNDQIGISNISFDNDPNDNVYIQDIYYDNKKILYQISQYVKFDITNGSLILQSSLSPKNISIYNRSSNPLTNKIISSPNVISNTSSSINNIDSNNISPSIITDILGNNEIIYIPSGKNTIVLLITKSNNDKVFMIRNIIRFTPKGVDSQENSNSMSFFNTDDIDNNNSDDNNNDDNDDYDDDNDHHNDHHNHHNNDDYPNLNSSGNPILNSSGYFYPGYGGPGYDGTGYGGPGYDGTGYGGLGYGDQSLGMNNYMLKTQIVPPVCPSCPSCSSCSYGSTCNNCGGNGGSGVLNTTLDSDGKILVYTTTDGSKYPISTLLNKAGSGGFKLVEDAGSGLVKLVEDAGTGGFKLAEDAGSGLLSLLNNNSQRQSSGQSSGQSLGQSLGQSSGNTLATTTGFKNQSSYIDQYSYFGKLPTGNTSNFMPITADFSSFKH